MEDSKSNARDDDAEEFHDALDDFPFYDCVETFSGKMEWDDALPHSLSDPKPLAENKTSPPSTLRRRRSFDHRQSSDTDTVEYSKPSSSVSLENYVNARNRKLRLSRKINESEWQFENSENLEFPGSMEVKYSLGSSENIVNREDKEKNGEHSVITGADNERNDIVGDESNLRETHDANSSLLLLLADLVIKAIGFQVNLMVGFLMFPIWLIYYSCLFAFNPCRVLRRARQHFIRKITRIWTFVCENVSPFVYEWLKEHNSMWKLGLKCGWGLLWSGYVCVVLTGLLVSAFIIGGLLIRRLVEEPIRLKGSLNFDYTEKSPVAFLPIIACPEVSHGAYLVKNPEIGKASGLRVIPPNHKLQVTVSLTLPESDYNQNLGIFQVRVDFLAADGRTLASLRRPCMLQFRSLPIRLLLTFVKVAPILTGYTSESQKLDMNLRGFIEGATPTACLKVIIEQRAEFLPGAGIPEINVASVSLESELPMLKKLIWYWKKTLFVWISLTLFTMELLFSLLCCKPIIMPRIRLREDSPNNSASQNNRPDQR
ncbi:putative adipose-regulatory protein (Seipin) [Forsythia ovata]|uniref:Adipose-regulatory protein (Seipin) n=1 Tax=Forsythia ovata TaxID=205694 RepID=A0ABD1S1T7_9LAMI